MQSILKGNLAPGGAVAKITGKEGLGFTGKARVFDSENEFVKAVEDGTFKKGEKAVAILRYLGPKGGPGRLLSPPRFMFGGAPLTLGCAFNFPSRHAGDAQAYQPDHGRGSWIRCRVSDRRSLQRRVRSSALSTFSYPR